MSRFSAQAEETLRQAGWHPGRQVPELVASWKVTLMASDGFVLFPTAERILLEFGGLSINQRARGKTCAREPFTFDPALAMFEVDRFIYYSELLNTRFYPLGEAAGRHYFWAVGENDHIYLLMDDLRLLGKNIEEALESLLIGIWPQDAL